MPYPRDKAPRTGVVALAVFSSLSSPLPSWAQTQPDLATCAGITEGLARLACYDRLAGLQGMMKLPSSPAEEPATPNAAAATTATAPSDSFMTRYWELSSADKRGTFNYTAYRPNYFLPMRVMRSVNNQPQSPTRGVATDLPHYQRGETKLQVSMRTKVLEQAFWPDADLWVAYTQQSMWQLRNQRASAPFRNSDFQPELIYVVPTPSALRTLPMGWTWQMAQFGLVHQSNGQAGALSRSWNRIYGSVGLEKGNVTAQIRLEQRLEKSSRQSDDNPDIVDHMGRVETQLTWSPGRSTAALLWRPSLRGRGLIQLDWTYPVYNDHPDGLRWYIQVFEGFGETLIDYNFRQTSLGFGLTLFKF